MTNRRANTRGSRQRRTGTVLVVLALAALCAFAVPGMAGAARPAAVTAKAKPTVVLVHGAFTDASSWTRVIERLQHAGYSVLAPADPLRSLSGDANYIASVLASVKRPVVLVGHSYAGMVITNAAAADANVKALVYISAYIPTVGESAVKLTGEFPGSQLTSALEEVPFTLPLRRAMFGRLTREQRLRRGVEDVLVGLGFSETYTPSLLAGDAHPDAIRLPEPISVEYSVLRTTLLPSLVGAGWRNIDTGAERIAPFEIA